MSPEELASALDEFTGTDGYHKHWLGLRYTDGVKFLADNAGAYWLIDAIGSHQPTCKNDKMLCDFQIWRLEVHDDRSAELICLRDSNDEAFRQHLEFTDFPKIGLKLYLENGVLMLPSER